MNAEIDRIQSQIAIGNKVQTVRKIAKEILLRGWFTYNGRFCDPKVKHIGCGVYEVWAVDCN